jgi:hypothetical protein
VIAHTGTNPRLIEGLPMRRSSTPTLGAQLAERAHLRRSERRSLVRLGAAALITHGLVHAMGLTLLWRWDDASNLRYNDHPTPGSTLGIVAGATCLLAGALFIAAGVIVLLGRRAWRLLAVIAVLLSVPVLIPFADAALAGLIVDLGVLIAVFLTYGTRPALATETSDPRT